MMKRPLKTFSKNSQVVLGKTAKYSGPISKGLIMAGSLSGQPELIAVGAGVATVGKVARTTNKLLKLTNKK